MKEETEFISAKEFIGWINKEIEGIENLPVFTMFQQQESEMLMSRYIAIKQKIKELSLPLSQINGVEFKTTAKPMVGEDLEILKKTCKKQISDRPTSFIKPTAKSVEEYKQCDACDGEGGHAKDAYGHYHNKWIHCLKCNGTGKL